MQVIVPPTSPTLVDLSPDGTRLAAAIASRRAIGVWDTLTGELLQRYQIRSGQVVDLLYLSRSHFAVLTEKSLLFSRERKQTFRRIAHPLGEISKIVRPVMAEDSGKLFARLIVSAHESSETQFSTVIRRFQLPEEKELAPLVFPGIRMEGDFDARQQRLFLADRWKTIGIRDATNGRSFAEIRTQKLRSFAVTDRALLTLQGATVVAYSTRDGSKLWSRSPGFDARCVFPIGGSFAGLVSLDQTIEMRETVTGDSVTRWDWKRGSLFSVAVAANAPTMAAAYGKEIVIWDANP